MNKSRLLATWLLASAIAGPTCTILAPADTEISRDTTRVPTRTTAGLFAAAAVVEPRAASIEVASEYLSVDGSVIDADDDGSASVQFTTTDIDTDYLAGDGLIWLEDETLLGEGDTVTIDVPVGVTEYALAVRRTDEDEVLDSVSVTVIGPRTPTARFGLALVSFLTGCGDELAEVVRTGDLFGGTVTVHLDGTPSSGGLLSTIDEYTWGVDGQVAATGPTVELSLDVGSHSIQLLVENTDGESHLFERTGIVVEPGLCPDTGGWGFFTSTARGTERPR